MPRRGRTYLGRHTPVQRRCLRMRANVPPLDQADVNALQQFIFDANAKIESERLQFLRREEDHLRADNYKDLRGTIVNQISKVQHKPIRSREMIVKSYHTTSEMYNQSTKPIIST